MLNSVEKPMRRMLRVPVQIESATGLVVARSIDIGRDGLTVLCATGMIPGVKQRVVLSLPSREQRNPVTIDLDAKVLTSVLAANGFKVALRFTSPQSEAVSQLASHLNIA